MIKTEEFLDDWHPTALYIFDDDCRLNW